MLKCWDDKKNRLDSGGLEKCGTSVNYCQFSTRFEGFNDSCNELMCDAGLCFFSGIECDLELRQTFYQGVVFLVLLQQF